MAIRSCFFAVLLLFAVSVGVNVSARNLSPDQHQLHAVQSGGRLGLRIDNFELVDVSQWGSNSNQPLELQIAVTVKGELQFLYANGEKVLATRNPDSVGTARTLWEVVDAPSDRTALSALSFALQNKDTGARLYYDDQTGSFKAAWVEGGQVTPLTNWRLWRSVEDGSRFKLQNVQAPGRGLFADWPESDEPQIFHIISRPQPFKGVAADLGVPILVEVEVGTKFQLTILENGKELYLYAEGQKVLKTADPNSVGNARSVWKSVPGIAPRSLDYAGAFAIRNDETDAVLLYDGQFYLEPNGGYPIAGWKLFIDIIVFPPHSEYKLTYLPYNSNGYIPGTFNYLPLKGAAVSIKTVA